MQGRGEGWLRPSGAESQYISGVLQMLNLVVEGASAADEWGSAGVRVVVLMTLPPTKK